MVSTHLKHFSFTLLRPPPVITGVCRQPASTTPVKQPNPSETTSLPSATLSRTQRVISDCGSP